MASRLTESTTYAHLWSNPQLIAIFDERNRLQSWLDILVSLAAAQAELQLIPADAAEQIAMHARADRLDLDLVAAETRRTSHSTLGLIKGLQAILPPPAGEYVYYGATVQDLTDTWFGLVMRDVGRLVRADLVRGLEVLVALATQHRDTVMSGRTHGQPGAPITFGFKAATWADEIGRHITRIDEGARRWATGQLAGAVGVLGFFEPDGLELRRRFCQRLGLNDPVISWTATRDRVAEFGTVLSLVASTLARIGTEVYELQRPEIGELCEATAEASVGSITMPHKRNAEVSEHLDTLSRVARASAGLLVEAMVGQHERDGRAWKTEWFALPEVALATGTATALAADLLEGLIVDAGRMRANLEGRGTQWASEQVLAKLARRIGKHRAQTLMQQALDRQADLAEALASLELVDAAEVAAWTAAPAVGTAGAMVDAVVRRATSRTDG